MVENLKAWHRHRKDGTQTIVQDTNSEDTENIDMNVVGNNFSILEIHVKPRSKKGCVKSKRKSIVGLAEREQGIVSPTLLRPLRSDGGTPGKSILKRQGGERCETPNKLSNICFSPFNGVKIISHRDELPHSPAFEDEMEYDDDGDDNAY